MKRIDEINRVDSTLNRAGDEEPIFILRANDPLAPTVVRAWVDKYIETKQRPGSPQEHQKNIAKAREALRTAAAMELWAHANGVES